MVRIIFFLLLLPFAALAQKGVPAGSPNPLDTTYFKGRIRVEQAVRFNAYATADTNKVLGVDAAGNLVLRNKGSEPDSIKWATTNALSRKHSIGGDSPTTPDTVGTKNNQPVSIIQNGNQRIGLAANSTGFIDMTSTGTTISRSVADANPILRVVQSNVSGNGDLLQIVNSAGANMLTIKNTGTNAAVGNMGMNFGNSSLTQEYVACWRNDRGRYIAMFIGRGGLASNEFSGITFTNGTNSASFYADNSGAANVVGTGNIFFREAINGSTNQLVMISGLNGSASGSAFSLTFPAYNTGTGLTGAGNTHLISFANNGNANWIPSSGSSEFNGFQFRPTYNASSAYSGIMSCINYNPVSTNLANGQIRALYLQHNSGYSLYSSGANSFLYNNGPAGFGVTTYNGVNKVNVGGSVLVTATYISQGSQPATPATGGILWVDANNKLNYLSATGVNTLITP